MFVENQSMFVENRSNLTISRHVYFEDRKQQLLLSTTVISITQITTIRTHCHEIYVLRN